MLPFIFTDTCQHTCVYMFYRRASYLPFSKEAAQPPKHGGKSEQPPKPARNLAPVKKTTAATMTMATTMMMMMMCWWSTKRKTMRQVVCRLLRQVALTGTGWDTTAAAPTTLVGQQTPLEARRTSHCASLPSARCKIITHSTKSRWHATHNAGPHTQCSKWRIHKTGPRTHV